ncbi:putative serine/threonine-protein kinase [Camellia lanceoleosa]|uniref:Serine/threonine-protein kinase n=1 Tax=Camellia lanceoleosa TaxID=1840588 RepID=A0ACC0HVQ5_9ERIC|nr:putative serine/threonine-protein kinase [Camellia lanceoleosa]
MANPRKAIPMASASSPSPSLTSLSPPQIPMELHEINRANLIKVVKSKLAIARITPNSSDCGVAADLWSAGCILAELYARKPIMPGRTEVIWRSQTFDLKFLVLGSLSLVHSLASSAHISFGFTLRWLLFTKNQRTLLPVPPPPSNLTEEEESRRQ